jgi:site-specific recombinase
LKTVITGAELPLLWETALTAANYSISFIILYHLGLSLATKQSSMTAAHLADALKHDQKRAGGVWHLLGQPS